MKYFSFSEMIVTNTQLPNIPNWEQIANLQRLINNLLDPIREKWGKPIKVNSGFRSDAVNAAINGAKNSQHKTGEAADITTGNPTDNKRLFEMIASSGLAYDQLIDEKNYQWIHISLSTRNRQQILHL